MSYLSFSKNNYKILVIRFSSLGDILLTTPCVALLKKDYPNSEIYFATKSIFSILLTGNNDIKQVFSILENESIFSFAKRIRSKKTFDLVIDLHNSLRSQLLRLLLPINKILIYKKLYLRRWLFIFLKINLLPKNEPIAMRYMKVLKPLNIQPQFINIKLPHKMVIHKNISKRSKVIISQIKKNKIIAIAPGSRWYTKTWPIKKFIDVTKILMNIQLHEYIFVFMGGPDEKDLGEQVEKEMANNLGKRVFNLISKLSILESFYLLSNAKVLLCNDSGLMHAASALQIKILPLFLSTVPEFGFVPWNLTINDIISYPLKCKPCNHKGLKKCPKKHFKCAELIEPIEVSRRLIKLLE